MRCAIYTRVSSDERAAGELGSIERQRELCESYVASQAEQGWIALSERFDDPGRSGGTISRPALKRLLDLVDAREVDVVVVYKLDRFSRDLRQTVRLIERLDAGSASLASATQPISTGDAIGRLFFNLMATFAQFEREVTGDRTRDRNRQARVRGLWTSGPPPFGYMLDPARKGRLLPHPERAKLVRLIYRRFVALRSFGEVAREMNEAGHRNRKGAEFEGRVIKSIVSRRVYRGELPHAGAYQPGHHSALVGEALWQQAATVLAEIGATPHRW